MEPYIFRKKEVLETQDIRELTDGEIDLVAGAGETTIKWETSVNGGPWTDDGTSSDWTDGQALS